MTSDFKADYKVKAGEFEGPIDLLLSLIERRKMNISDVSLSMVTLLTVTSQLSHLMFLKIWGRMADRFSSKSELSR